MAEADTPSCRCSNISIMQLFHELKQNFPNVPDQIVSKVIQQNYHDKSACEALLLRENTFYSVQAYPGAIISGDPRARSADMTPPDHCPAGGAVKCPVPHHDSKSSQSSSRTTSHDTTPTSDSDVQKAPPKPRALSLQDKLELSKLPLGRLVQEAHERVARRAESRECDDQESTQNEPAAEGILVQDQEEAVLSVSSKESAAVSNAPKIARPTSFGCDIPQLPIPSFSALSIDRSESVPPKSSAPRMDSSPSRLAPPPSTSRLLTPPNEHYVHRQRLNESFPHNQTSAEATSDAPQDYEVAVECVVTPGTPGDQQRSFTSVSLRLRPPSVETTLPIDISYGKSLTYTSASFDPRQGYQSHLQIRIGPALLQHQRERKELLARELRKKKERLRAMQSRVHAMKLALARAAATPKLLSRLKADIEQLRVECERLTAAVDTISQQNPENVPLGAGWNCRICTFRNHPLLTVCEECEMPRLSIGSSNLPHRPLTHTSVFTNNNPPCSGGETSTSASRKITPIQEL